MGYAQVYQPDENYILTPEPRNSRLRYLWRHHALLLARLLGLAKTDSFRILAPEDRHGHHHGAPVRLHCGIGLTSSASSSKRVRLLSATLNLFTVH